MLSAPQAHGDAEGDADWLIGVDSTIARMDQHGALTGIYGIGVYGTAGFSTEVVDVR